jgi:hypothetical protein
VNIIVLKRVVALAIFFVKGLRGWVGIFEGEPEVKVNKYKMCNKFT